MLEAIGGECACACVCVSFAIRTDVSAACHFDADLHQQFSLMAGDEGLTRFPLNAERLVGRHTFCCWLAVGWKSCCFIYSFSFIFLLRKKVGSKVSESLVFFPLLFFFLESIWNFPGVIAALTHSRSINKQKVGTVVLLSSVQITVESHLSAASGNRELRLVHSFKYSHTRLQADCKPFGEHLSFRSESALVYSAWGPAGKSPRLMQFYVQAI